MLFLFLISIHCASTEIWVISDTHFYGPQSMNKGLLQDKFDVSLGDIFDAKNTLKANMLKMREDQNYFSDFCEKNNIPEIQGNHDKKEGILFYVWGDVLFTHGHYVSWDSKKIEKEERKEAKGISKIKFNSKKIIFDSHPTTKLSEEEIAKAASLAKKYNCRTIVFGHTHVNSLIDIEYDGVRVINVPRGITQLNL